MSLKTTRRQLICSFLSIAIFSTGESGREYIDDSK
jgi:hypothetical protein